MEDLLGTPSTTSSVRRKSQTKRLIAREADYIGCFFLKSAMFWLFDVRAIIFQQLCVL